MRRSIAVMTGVSRYALTKKGLAASGFVDLTLDENYAAAMGFTRDEMDAYFREHNVDDAYFGYRFSNRTLSVYPPHAVLPHTTDDQPTKYALTLLKERPHTLFMLRNLTDADLLLRQVGQFDAATTIATLFQTGCLTIKNCTTVVRKRFSCQLYDLGFATPRIEEYFLDAILEQILARENITTNDEFSAIRRHLTQFSLSAFVTTLNERLRSTGYAGHNVKVYRQLVECLLRVAGVNAISRQRVDEPPTRIDKVECVFAVLTDRSASEALRTLL